MKEGVLEAAVAEATAAETTEAAIETEPPPPSISSRMRSSSDLASLFLEDSSLEEAVLASLLILSPELVMSKGTPEGPKID